MHPFYRVMIWSLAAGAVVVNQADAVDIPPDNTITTLLNAGSSSKVASTTVVNAIMGDVYETQLFSVTVVRSE